MPATLVAAEVDHDAGPLVGDLLHRRSELRAAVAASRTEHVAGQALAVDPNEDAAITVLVDTPGDVAVHEGQVLDPVECRLEGVAAKTPHSVGISTSAIRRTNCSVRRRNRIRSAIVIISSPCSVANSASSGDPGHAGLVDVDDLAQHARRLQPGHPGEVDGGLGVAGPFEDTARPRLRGAARGRGSARSCGAVVGSTSARIVAARSPAEMPVVVPAFASTLTRNSGLEDLGVVDHHRVELEVPVPGRR